MQDSVFRERLMNCLVLCFIFFAATCIAADKNATAEYASLLERAKNGDQTIDFRRLRLAYADSAAYENAPDTEPQKKAMWSALKTKDFQAAVKNADIVLNADYADMGAHYVEQVAFQELRNSDLSRIHAYIFRALLKSITDSGDGKSPETAYQVIEVHEEYVLLRALGVALPKQQSSVQRNKHSFDKITFDDPQSGEQKIIYFNVDIPMKHGL